MKSMKIFLRPASAAILGVCLIAAAGVAGHFAVKTVKAYKTLNRVVTARGLAEREVQADLALWPLNFKVVANSLPSLETEIAKAREEIAKFLVSQGFDRSEISNLPPKIQDFESNGYVGNGEKSPFRYSAEGCVQLRSVKIDKVVAALEKADSMVRGGVALVQDYDVKPKFLFTGLRALKPAMIEEANKDARKAAEKFALDSNCGVGRIMRATQGSFEIEERDPQMPQLKIVRVVTTVDFLLD